MHRVCAFVAALEAACRIRFSPEFLQRRIGSGQVLARRDDRLVVVLPHPNGTDGSLSQADRFKRARDESGIHDVSSPCGSPDDQQMLFGVDMKQPHAAHRLGDFFWNGSTT